jgi:hypothetical protein
VIAMTETTDGVHSRGFGLRALPKVRTLKNETALETPGANPCGFEGLGYGQQMHSPPGVSKCCPGKPPKTAREVRMHRDQKSKKVA